MNPNTTTETLTGSSAEEVEVSPQYEKNVITIVGLDEGIVTVKAKAQGNTVFEKVRNGEIRLGDNYHTLTIRNVQIDAFQFEVTPEAAYTVKIKQTNADTER